MRREGWGHRNGRFHCKVRPGKEGRGEEKRFTRMKSLTTKLGQEMKGEVRRIDSPGRRAALQSWHRKRRKVRRGGRGHWCATVS